MRNELAITCLIILAGITGLIAYLIHLLIGKIIKAKVEYEHRYAEYYQAEQDINDIEWDMKNHQEDKP